MHDNFIEDDWNKSRFFKMSVICSSFFKKREKKMYLKSAAIWRNLTLFLNYIAQL